MKKLIFHTAMLMLVLNGLQAQKIVGLYPSWSDSSKLNTLPYQKLTDITYAFAYPDYTGDLQPKTLGGLYTMVDKAHKAGIKAHIAIGGASNSSAFGAAVSSISTRQTFINALFNIVNKYHLDGVNIDWEFPSENDAYNLLLFLQAIKNKMPAIELSVSVAPGLWNNEAFSSDLIEVCDYVYIMAFDGKGSCCGCDLNNHSSLAVASMALQKWTGGLPNSCGLPEDGKNTPAKKLVLGIPYYSGLPNQNAYKNFSNIDPAGFYNDADGIYAGYDYNSCPLISNKIDLLMNQYSGAGVFMWELTMDRSDSYSLTECIYEKINALTVAIKIDEGDSEIYPNPSSESFIIHLKNFDQAHSAVIYTAGGQFAGQFNISAATFEFGSTLPAGIYYLVVQNEESLNYYKLIKLN